MYDEHEIERRLRKFGEFLASMTEEERRKYYERMEVSFQARIDQFLAKFRDEYNLDSVQE